MTIGKHLNGSKRTINPTGRPGTTTASVPEPELKQSFTGAEKLVHDFAALAYLSSTGIRVLLASQKVMKKKGETIIKNMKETGNEVFEVAGCPYVFTIESFSFQGVYYAKL